MIVPYCQTDAVTLWQGDVLERLASLPAESCQVCVTSPPYFGLRDYGLPASVWGGDPSCPHTWEEVWTPNNNAGGGVTRKQATNAGSFQSPTGGGALPRKTAGPRGRSSSFCRCGAWKGCLGGEGLHDCCALQRRLEPCSHCFVCHLVTVFRAIRRVLRKDGTLWLNLGDSYNGSGGAGGDYGPGGLKEGQPKYPGRKCAGLKPKDLMLMPARVALALQADGWWVRSDIIWIKPNPMPESVDSRPTSSHEHLFLLSRSPSYYYDAESIRESDGGRPSGNGFIRPERLTYQDKDGGRGQKEQWIPGRGRNKRNVWSIPTRPFSAKSVPGYTGSIDHYATYPPDLVRPCILAGSRPGDVVLDPFSGSGTTGVVALEHGRRYVGIELSPEYCELSAARLRAPVAAKKPKKKREPRPAQRSLFGEEKAA